MHQIKHHNIANIVSHCYSVSMTAVSTAVGIGFMPLNLWLYSRRWTDTSTVVPYKNIIIALACLVLPVPVGMAILKKWPKVAAWVGRVGIW